MRNSVEFMVSCIKLLIMLSYICRYYEWQTRDGKKQPYLLYAPTATTDVLKAVNMDDLISGREEG